MLPFFSVIIPTHARPRQLMDCLEALARLNYPCERFEVIVVDDGSASSPDEIVARFRPALNVNLIVQAQAGPATARNTGVAHAQGRFLAFIDDDCWPDADWLQALTAHLRVQPERMIGGRTLNALPRNLYSTASQLLIDYLYAYYNAEPQQAQFVASNNLALSTELFLKLGGFDASFPFAAGEDRELCARWLSQGFQMTYAPEAMIYHAHPLTFQSFWRQHFNYGRGAFRFRAGRARRLQQQMRFESAAFYWNLIAYPFRMAGRLPEKVFILGLFLISQLGTVLGFMREAVWGFTTTLPHPQPLS
jgi:GT2 family glycosyltransferase